MKDEKIIKAILKLAECIDALERFPTGTIRTRKMLIMDILGVEEKTILTPKEEK